MTNSEPNQAIIQARDVEKWFGNFAALKGVSADIPRGRSSRGTRSFRIWEIDIYPLY